MKTTMLTQPIANPRRTRLAQLKDAEEPTTTPQAGTDADQATSQDAPADQAPAEQAPLPRQIANPRRTVLDKLPTS